MKTLTKKIVIYSMIGLMQLGLGSSVLEASPKHNEQQHSQRYQERAHHEQQHNGRDQRIHEEKDRHTREMQRHEFENDREWHERQDREREHHEEVMRAIGGLAILGLILSND